MPKYFTDAELACKSTGIIKLAPKFGEALDRLREMYGKPMVVNSCCRSTKHNVAIGGSPRSLHVYDTPFYKTGGACAIDIKMFNAHEASKLAMLALNAGWSVGVNEAFLHLDCRTICAGLPQSLFTY